MYCLFRVKWHNSVPAKMVNHPSWKLVALVCQPGSTVGVLGDRWPTKRMLKSFPSYQIVALTYLTFNCFFFVFQSESGGKSYYLLLFLYGQNVIYQRDLILPHLEMSWLDFGPWHCHISWPRGWHHRWIRTTGRRTGQGAAFGFDITILTLIQNYFEKSLHANIQTNHNKPSCLGSWSRCLNWPCGILWKLTDFWGISILKKTVLRLCHSRMLDAVSPWVCSF